MTRLMTLRNLTAMVAVAALFALAVPPHAATRSEDNRGRATVILVHGAWADGSSWAKVIPLLRRRGLAVVAVQLPLTSLAEDVATVRQAIGRVDGPVLLVAHSYGGVVITEAGTEPTVEGLVYVAAFAPKEGQSAFLLVSGAPTPILQQLREDQHGFLTITPIGIRRDFAPDLSDPEQAVLAATQSPTAGAGSLGAPVSTAAWRSTPTWFVIAGRDRVVAPALQAAFARQMGATSIVVPSSHVVMLSHPYQVASFIRQAVGELR